MTKPSNASTAFVIVFGMIFAGFGLAMARTLLAADPAKAHGNSWVGVLLCGVFVLIGLGIIYGGIYGNRKLKEQYAVQLAQPDTPWLWQKDWAASRAESKDRNNAVGLWVLAGFWNAISLTIAILVAPKLWRESDPKVFFPLLFALLGVILAAIAVRASIRRERFGKTYFEFASLPFSPGKTLKGAIHLHFDTTTRHGIDLTLSCVRRVVEGSGKNRSTAQIILWQSQANVPQQSVAPGPMGDAAIPVNFAVPSDAYETNHDQLNDQVVWLLHAQADVPGVDYADDFEVPVFRLTPASVTASSDTVFGDSQPQAAPGFQSDASDVAAPEKTKVVISTAPTGGTEFYFPPFRNPIRVMVLFLVTVGFGGVIYALHHFGGPWVFTIAFGLMELFLVYGVIQSTLGSYRIELDGTNLRASRAVLGMSSTREILFSEIEKILPVSSNQPGTNLNSATYSLRLQTKDGKQITLVNAIDDRQEARWTAAQLEKCVGLKLDTHVAVDNPLGAYGPPPQRGMALPGQAMAFRRGNAVAMAVGMALMAAWIGFLGYRIFSVRHGVPRPAFSRSRGSAKFRAQRVTYTPLTDAEAQRLQLLPEQEQAEELLDRAIHHDDRARDMFEQDIAMWQGGIKLTERMKELERRSSFSTDLRVRYINADLNLGMDGWAKTQNSVDLLITQAQTKGSRAAAVYEMGMLAGRGVGYNLIYPVLVDYAKNDPDPYVRQWAVEGIRYLGTDEALDQLFYSFTHDPSYAVRERAGCNISDCGNFTRKQRMRMAPKLIALAEDPKTTPQMRNWTFLALTEITDQHLPADAEAWERWYTDHGADKMAEFEQLDWWRVRGDE
ncbi:MAG: HEAT repeat domain-containing protein [Terriglobales bacterium]